MPKFKDVKTTEGVFAPIDPKTKTGEILMDVWNENIKKRQAIRSVHLVQRLIKADYHKIRNTKESIRWYKKTYRRLQRLIKSNPDTIYIYDHTMLRDDGCEHVEGEPEFTSPHWMDIHIAVPNWRGKLIQRWICTLATYKLGESDQEDTKKFGGEWRHLEPEDPEDRFDEMFFDLPDGFKDEQMVCDCFREWMKYFLPELADRKIEYKEIEEIKIKGLHRAEEDTSHE